MKGIDILIEARMKMENNGLELLQKDIERLEYENDTLKAFIIDIYNASATDRLNVVFDAMDYLKKLKQSK